MRGVTTARTRATRACFGHSDMSALDLITLLVVALAACALYFLSKHRFDTNVLLLFYVAVVMLARFSDRDVNHYLFGAGFILAMMLRFEFMNSRVHKDGGGSRMHGSDCDELESREPGLRTIALLVDRPPATRASRRPAKSRRCSPSSAERRRPAPSESRLRNRAPASCSYPVQPSRYRAR